MRQVLLGLVVGVILGTGIGSTLFSKDHIERQDMSLVGLEAPIVIESLNIVEPPLTRSDPTRNAAPKREVAEPSTLSKAWQEEADSSTTAASSEQEPGPGVIRGRVLDSNGRALAGVLVRAQRQADRSHQTSAPSSVGALPQPTSLERHLRDAAQKYAAGRSRSYEVVSDTAGEFTLKELREGQYHISTYAEGYLLRKKGGAASSFDVQTGDEIELVAEAILNVRVSVLRADGTEVEHAIVRCSDHPIMSEDDWSESLFGHGKNDFTWSPSSPLLRLPAKTVHLKAFANPSSSEPVSSPNGVDFHSESVEVKLTAGTTPPAVLLSIESRPGIRGRVVFPAERLPNTIAEVHLLAIPPSGQVDLKALAYADPTVRLLRGDAQFAFLDIAPGRYAVGVNRDWGSPINAHEIVEVGADILQCELRLPPPDLDNFIHVRVLTPDREVVADAHFSFTHRNKGSSASYSTGSPIKTREGGYLYSIPVESMNAYYEAPTATEEFFLSAHAAGYGEMEALLTPGQRELTIQLTEKASLVVSVLGIAGTGLEGRLEILLRALLEEREGTHNSAYGQDVSPEREAHFTGLAAQRYQLTLRTQWRHNSPGNYQNSTELLTTDLMLQAGANFIEVTAPPVYKLEVLLEGTQEARSVSLKRLSPETGEVLESIASQNTDELGRALFDQLTAGRYRVEAQGTESLDAFTVPCSPVTLKVQR